MRVWIECSIFVINLVYDFDGFIDTTSIYILRGMVCSELDIGLVAGHTSERPIDVIRQDIYI